MNKNVFKAMRLYKGMSQKQFAELLDLSEATVANIEAGVRPISDRTRARIATNIDVGEDFSSFLLRFQEVNFNFPS